MPSKSKQQQKFMGIVRAIQKGEAPAGKFSKPAQDAAKSMKKSSVKKYAKTKHDDLPVKKESTAAYKKSLEKIARDKQLKMISKKDKEILMKISKMMKESLSASQFKAAHKKFKDTGELPPHLKKLVKDLDKVKVKHKVKNIVVPGLEWMSKIKESLKEAERDYKDEYKKFQSSTKSKKYRAELNKYNRKKGTYGNGDGKDASHKGGKIVGFEKESKNRGRAEKSRLKKEDYKISSKHSFKIQDSGNGIILYGKHGKIMMNRDELKNFLLGLKKNRLGESINENDKVEVLKHLIKRGDNPKDAKKDVQKLYNKVNKMYKNASASKKAEIISALSAKMESVKESKSLKSKVKYYKTISKKEWSTTSNDYKSVIDGIKYKMFLDPKKGTILAPVKVEGIVKSVDESKTSNMMRDIRKGGTAGPWDIIISKNNKVVTQVSVKNLKEIPAYLASLRIRYPNHKIGIEAKSGKIVYRESIDEASMNNSLSEGFGGELKGNDKKKFENDRKSNGEQLGYTLTGEADVKESLKKIVKEEVSNILNEAIEPSGIMAKINKIVQDKQAMKIGGVLLDMFSANIMMRIFNAVNDKSKEQMNKGNIRQVQVILHKVMKQNKVTK